MGVNADFLVIGGMKRMMSPFLKVLLCLLVLSGFNLDSQAQGYFAFPTDDGVWSEYTWVTSPPDVFHINSRYYQQGDTVLNGQQYSQLWYQEGSDQFYAGGLREDGNKGIWFYPDKPNLPPSAQFPSDSAEFLLYSFANLQVGSSVYVNDSSTVLFVQAIDSVLVGSAFRKAYTMNNSNALTVDRWIEGIGSIKGVLFPAGFDFGWVSYLLCYEDANVFFHNPYNAPSPTCEMMVTTTTEELADESALKVYPNPANGRVSLVLPAGSGRWQLEWISVQGALVKQSSVTADQSNALDVSDLPRGIYILKVTGETQVMNARVILH